MNFSKKQKDYIIHALEHCEVLTGGRSSGKILELIKQQNKEIERLKEELKYTIPIVEHNKTITKHLKEIERLNNIINDIDRYIHNWNLEDIGEKTMLILNDILLIKNGMSDEVIRLKGSDK